MLKSVAGRLLALKVLAVTAGAAAAGGVAYAATTGDLPTGHGKSALHANADSSAAPASDDDSSSAAGSSTGASAPDSSSAADSSAPDSSAAPSPSLVGLCHAWQAHPQNDLKLSTNPAYSVLVQAAGGTDAVNGYCVTLLASAHPTHPARPTQAKNPTDGATPSVPVSTPAHPTGKPSGIPSHAHSRPSGH